MHNLPVWHLPHGFVQKENNEQYPQSELAILGAAFLFSLHPQ